MQAVPQDRFQRLLYYLLWLVLVISCIDPPWMDFLLMQHAPTVVVIVFLGWLSNRMRLSQFSYAAIALFLVMHILGARYLYSYTPYDKLAEFIFGMGISEFFGFERNHYDRLVHFLWGFLIAIPIQEAERRYLKLSAFASSVLAVEAILATSAAYEILEWWVAVVFAADWAESFLGQQGDPFDAQKDMALAFLGALLSMALFGRNTRWQEETLILSETP